jgi:hypothetical protein
MDVSGKNASRKACRTGETGPKGLPTGRRQPAARLARIFHGYHILIQKRLTEHFAESLFVVL